MGYSKTFFQSSGVLYQAWSAGKPVIASSHGLIGQRVKQNNAGILVDIDKSIEIREAINFFSQDVLKYRSLVKNAELAGKKYTKKTFINSLLDSIYE